MSNATKLRKLFPIVIAIVLSGCGGGGSSGGVASLPAATTPAQTSSLPQIHAVADSCTDCWPMFEHDVGRSGQQTAQTGISSNTVSQLQLRWSYNAGESIVSSPVVADGTVFVATGAGSVIAIDQRTGTPKWRFSVGGPITMTPLVAEGLVFIGSHVPKSNLYALDEQSGTPRWHVNMSGYATSSPALINGTLIIGQSGGDPPGCIQGGVLAYQASTGILQWKWNTDATPHNGGAVWTPISYGGSDVVFGTGNTCTPNVANGDDLIRLTTFGQQEWLLPPQVNSLSDDDWGGSQLLYGGDIYSINKNGYFYGIDGRSGAIKFKLQVTPLDGSDSIGSPVTNGSTFVVPTGFLKQDPTTKQDSTAAVLGVSLGGTRLWSIPTLNIVHGGAAITNDLAFVSIDERLAAIQIDSGKEVWSYAPPGSIYASASPAIVSTGVYYANIAGQVMSFGLAAATAAGEKRAQSIMQRPPTTLREPYGPLVRKLSNGTYRNVF